MEGILMVCPNFIKPNNCHIMLHINDSPTQSDTIPLKPSEKHIKTICLSDKAWCTCSPYKLGVRMGLKKPKDEEKVVFS